MWQEGDQIGIVLEHSAPGGHYSEVARHVFIGEPDREFKEGYELLKEAQAAGFEAMKPGNTVGDVAQAVENVMTKSAYGAYLKDGVNNMGHGQGLDIWEYPMINREDKTVLAPGMRLNLHPNVKFQDGKTANCCELYLVTENGAEKLSTLPTELTIVE
jgi:Xaa-Pro aminopeptidase